MPFTNEYIEKREFVCRLNHPIPKKFRAACEGTMTNRNCFETIKTESDLERFALNSSLFSPEFNYQADFCKSLNVLKDRNKKLWDCLNNLDQHTNSEFLTQMSSFIKIGMQQP